MCCRKKDRTKKNGRTSCVMCAELQNGSFVNFRINCTHCIKHEHVRYSSFENANRFLPRVFFASSRMATASVFFSLVKLYFFHLN